MWVHVLVAALVTPAGCSNVGKTDHTLTFMLVSLYKSPCVPDRFNVRSTSFPVHCIQTIKPKGNAFLIIHMGAIHHSPSHLSIQLASPVARCFHLPNADAECKLEAVVVDVGTKWATLCSPGVNQKCCLTASHSSKCTLIAVRNETFCKLGKCGGISKPMTRNMLLTSGGQVSGAQSPSQLCGLANRKLPCQFPNEGKVTQTRR